MKEWQLRQQVYHRLTHNHADITPVVYQPDWQYDPNTVQLIGSYFISEWTELIQPHKSYAVAIIYAKLLQKCGYENYNDALTSPTLLWDDLYFHPRTADTDWVYTGVEHLLTANQLWDFKSSEVPQVISTVDYFYKEFVL